MAAPSSVASFAPRLRSPGKVLGPRGNRAIATILDATRQIFLTRGYAGTTIDEIAKAAGMSRASFYTYFPSKRDVLLALGVDSANIARGLIDELEAFSPDWDVSDLEVWVRRYFELLDEHGSFAFAWTQAAHEDGEIGWAGMRGHLALCERFGAVLASLGDSATFDPTVRGLVAFSTLERAWAYCQLYAETVDVAAVQRDIAEVLAASVR